MLQWMGGSRRKVAASHTSVKKRQKQYFEQRRRQQQQSTFGSDCYTEEMKKSSSCQREHRSLDILSLLNLSTCVPDCKSSCPKDDLDVDASSLKYNIPRGSLTIPVETYTTTAFETKGAGSSSGYIEKPVSEKKTSFSYSDNYTNGSSGLKNRTDVLMESTEQKLSVFDLVGDDDLTIKLEENPICEAHVAFSIEGLGKIDTETPPHSPQQPERCSLPLKNTSRPVSSNISSYKHSDLENEVDASWERNDIFQGDNPLGFSTGGIATGGFGKQKQCAVRDYAHTPCTSNLGRCFHDIAEFGCSIMCNKYEWDAGSTFLESNFIDNGEDSLHWEDQQLWQAESMKDDFLKYGNDHVPGCTSAGHTQMKKRDYTKAKERFNIPDSPVERHRILERRSRYPSFNRTEHFNPRKKFDFGDVNDRPVWSSFLAEEEYEALSMLSEESCSSSAVWANETTSSHLNSRTRLRRRDLESFCCAGDRNCLDNSFAEELWAYGREYGKSKEGSGKYATLSNLGKSKSASHGCFPSPLGGLELSSNKIVDGFMSTDPALGSSYFLSSSSKPCCRDPFEATLDLPAFRSSGGITPKRGTHVFLDLEFDGVPPGSSAIAGSSQDASAPKFSVDGGSGNDEYNEASCLPAEFKFCVGQEICDEDSETASDKGRKTNVIKSKDEKVRCKELKDGIGPLGNLEAIQEQVEETSSSVKISENSSDSPVENECNYHREVGGALHEGNAGPEDRKSGGTISRKTSEDSSQQGMVLERHVLQLVCLEKALLLDGLRSR